MEKQAAKYQHWELYKECKNYLEENDKNWINRRQEREQENKKPER